MSDQLDGVNPNSLRFTQSSIGKFNPNSLRFTQDSIGKFLTEKDGTRLSVEDARDKIKNKTLKAEDFPLIQVYTENQTGITWSKDNRRLWVFRMADLTSISVEVLDRPFRRIPAQNSAQRTQWAAQDYFPRVRGGEECVDSDDDEISTSSSAI